MLPNSYDMPFSTSKTMKWMLSYTHLHDLLWCPLNRGVHLVNVYLLRIRQETSESYRAICSLMLSVCLIGAKSLTINPKRLQNQENNGNGFSLSSLLFSPQQTSNLVPMFLQIRKYKINDDNEYKDSTSMIYGITMQVLIISIVKWKCASTKLHLIRSLLFLLINLLFVHCSIKYSPPKASARALTIAIINADSSRDLH